MKIARKEQDYQLNIGDGMAKGLYNMKNKTEVSNWFHRETKDKLMELNSEDFIEECEKMIKLIN